MDRAEQDLIDRAWLGRALQFYRVSDDDLATGVSAMSESWKTEIAARLGRLATDLHDLALVAAEAERRFLDATATVATRDRLSMKALEKRPGPEQVGVKR